MPCCPSHAPRARVGSVLAALALLLLAGCGSSGPATPTPPPFVAQFPDDTPGGGGELPVTTPPPGSLPPLFLSDAWQHERSAVFGSFPSDVVLHGTTAFANDADQIEEDGAIIVPLDISTGALTPSEDFEHVVVRDYHLVDTRGVTANVNAPIGFGFYLNDIEIASDHLGFVLVNAGGSDSDPTLSNLVAFDPTSGAVIQVVSLATSLPSQGRVDSRGQATPQPTYRQSAAEALAYVPLGFGQGRLYVAMANLVYGPPSYGAVRYPGTIQVYDVRTFDAQPVRPRNAGAAYATQTLVLDGYNPVALETITATNGRRRLLVTVAGATDWAPDFMTLEPKTPAFVLAFDAETVGYLGSFDLGLVGLAAARPALGEDRVGHHVGFFPSAVTGEVYLLRLDGLYTEQVDPTRLAVLRGPKNGIPIAPEDVGRPGGNVSAVGLVAGSRALLVAGFGDLFALPTPRPGRLYLIELPADLITGSGFGANFVPGATLLETVAGRTLGAIAVAALGGGRPDALVAVSGPLDPVSGLGEGPASLGALWLRQLFEER